MILGFFKWTLFIYCPNVPKALGTFNRDSRLKVLMYMVTFAHVHGHVCSL